MQKRIIPILIGLMSVALLGIIFIQYRWIDRAVDEKQALIDNNVYQAVNDVEVQLNDHRAMTFISQSPDTEMMIGFGTEFDEDIQVISENHIDSNMQMEISVISSDDNEWDEKNHIYHKKIEQKIVGDLDSLTIIEISEGLGQIETVINKMKFEIHSDHDYRLDSLHFAHILTNELDSKGLGEIKKWAVWDNEKDAYQLEPSNTETTDFDYEMALFTSDIVHPGRYSLRLSLHNNNLIWDEIWPMIAMSLVFILIITAVFAYSIKLVIKHKKISQIKSDFINNMTHEFKTPLASITLAADSLTHPNTQLNKENVQKYVDIIQSEKNKLNWHVERILEVAALNKGELYIPIDKVDFESVLTKVMDHYVMQESKGILSIDYPEMDELAIMGNSRYIDNVLTNVIENGIKYSKDKPEISIEVDEKKGCVLISDKGIGMTEEQLDKAFDKFYRVQSGNLHDTKGFGLGLSYCKLVMEKMGGSIDLKSKPGEGTTATLQFAKA